MVSSLDIAVNMMPHIMDARRPCFLDVEEAYERLFSATYDNTHQVASVLDIAYVLAVIERFSRTRIRVADWGCGTGRNLVPLIRLARQRGISLEVVAVDIIKRNFTRIQNRLPKAGFHLRSTAQQDLMTSLAIESCEIHFVTPAHLENANPPLECDIIVNFLSHLSHFQTSPERCFELQRICRHLSSDGVLILTVPNAANRYIKSQEILKSFDGFSSGDGFASPFVRDARFLKSAQVERLFCHGFSISELRSLSQCCGLSPVAPIGAARVSAGYGYIQSDDGVANFDDACRSLEMETKAAEAHAADLIGIFSRSRRFSDEYISVAVSDLHTARDLIYPPSQLG